MAFPSLETDGPIAQELRSIHFGLTAGTYRAAALFWPSDPVLRNDHVDDACPEKCSEGQCKHQCVSSIRAAIASICHARTLISTAGTKQAPGQGRRYSR